MALSDARGVPTSATDPKSLEILESAIRQFQIYRGDAVATIDRALADDPDFVAGHIFRTEMHMMLWERSVLPEVEAGLGRLRALADKATERERAHIAAIADWAAGDWQGMSVRLDRIVADEPRDVVALQCGHLSDFFQGDRDNLRGRVARALPAWSEADPGYGILLGMTAFGLEECGDYGAAEEAGRQALALEPDDCWAQHAVCHVLEMQARQEEGIAFMEDRRAHWAQDDNTFAFHNWWHVSLFNLDNDRYDRVLQIYDTVLQPEPSEVQLEMLDAAALLWRLHLRGIDTGDRFGTLAATYEALAAEHGFYAFNDMHAMMAYVATGRESAAASLEKTAVTEAEGTGTNARMTREVGLPIVRAIRAFGTGRYGEAVDLLMPVRYRAWIFGGSHAQRDIVHRTLIEAAIRDGQQGLAQALANERVSLKPDCPFSRSLSERCGRVLN
ncbi:MAG: tetratricopeptide repeat protein [Rhodospirillales bacterium]|nr:tetratricopeptide repeat protein [Rhodospirillales bacterium]MDE0377774.1 tetratricopeptide repeat protein [Rhodospirillales bacterium]